MLTKTSIAATLTVTAKGQVTLRKEVLKHLGVRPGDKVAVQLDPDGTAILSAKRAGNSIEDFIGSLYDPNGPKLTIEEIKQVTEQGWMRHK